MIFDPSLRKYRLTIPGRTGHSSDRTVTMLGLTYLFYPWGIFVQIAAMIHFYRRRSENFWFYVIIFRGFVGAAAYLAAEALPDLALLKGTFQGLTRRSRIKKLEIAILDNPAAGNYEELGELLLEQRQFAKGREASHHAISARSDSLHAFFERAQCSLGLGDLAAAIPDLERVVAKDRKFAYYRAAGLLADAYARSGRLDLATPLFAEVAQFSTTAETLYNYANFLKLENRRAEAREWTQKLLAKKRTLPGYMQRVERPWFRKAKSLQKELANA